MTYIQKEKKRKEKNGYDKKDDLCSIISIPDELWDEIKGIFPKEKPSKTIGRPIIPI